MRRAAMLLAAAALSACRGTVPATEGIPDPVMGAVAIGGKIILPSGESRSGDMAINLEGEGGRQAEIYRLPVRLKRATLFEVEPGVYHLTPTRSLLGFHQPNLTVRIEHSKFKIPFPKDILRKAAIKIKPGRAVALGILEARVIAPLPGQEPEVKVYLNDSIVARRSLVEDLIHDMMDSSTPLAEREHAISWSRSLQNSLIDLASESERPELFKRAQ
jgi:hypothetical protein